MAKWELLIAARERKHLSQAEAARRINVGLATYQRWELGHRKPQPQHRRHLYEVLDISLEQQEQIFAQGLVEHLRPLGVSPISLLWGHAVEAKDGNPQAPVAVTMTSHLWSFVFMDHPTCSDKRASISQAIKEFDAMHANNKNYQITRREALCSLATRPLITLGLATPGQAVPATQYSQALAQCAASLEACWELRKSEDPGDRVLASRCATMYLPTLIAIACDTSQYRNEALDLATRYTLIKAFIARHSTNLVEAIQEGKQAIALSKETGDIPLQLYASESLAWSYLFARRYTLALTIMQETEALLRRAESLLKAQPFHLQIQSRTYSSLAIIQARNGLPLEHAVGKVMEIDPGDASVSFLDFKRSIMFLEMGAAYCYQGDQAKAMEWFEKRVDPETLDPRITQSELGRVETLNLMTLASLRGKNRDMERTLHWWMHGLQGSLLLRSEQRFAEALANYEFMEIAWPGEKRIASMRKYVVHWDT
jgi:transcriptional regulator with XRE-family HTH domain/tetratricopeptide (TPR) repeat protein